MIDSAPPLCAAVRGKLAEQENRIRKEFIDYDARRKPRTRRYCVRCQKDIDPGKPTRKVYVSCDMEAIHLDDLGRYVPSEGDCGWLLIGNDCARILGIEWTLPELAGETPR
jgi:hypothetical protein